MGNVDEKSATHTQGADEMPVSFHPERCARPFASLVVFHQTDPGRKEF